MAPCWQGAQRGRTGSGALRRGPNRPDFFVPQSKDQLPYGELWINTQEYLEIFTAE